MSNITVDTLLKNLMLTETKVHTRLKRLGGVLLPNYKKSCPWTITMPCSTSAAACAVYMNAKLSWMDFNTEPV